MRDSTLKTPNQSVLLEEIRRGWRWVVFAAQLLGRVGGLGAWVQAMQRLVGLLGDRATTKPGNNAPSSVFVPGQYFYEAAAFPFATQLEAHWPTILAELTALRGQHFIPWSEKHLYNEGWSTFGLYAFGVKIGKNCDLCPATTALLEQIPNLITAGFSALAPGTHIAPHTGYPDGVLRCHLGLIVPENCAIRVEDQTRSWQEGRCLIFDDTAEHEAWNQSDRLRVVLLLDFKPS
jgi:ornithine lipid ester-linked acyl 2-hydroxylase